MTEKDIDNIVWFIPFRKARHSLRELLKTILNIPSSNTELIKGIDSLKEISCDIQKSVSTPPPHEHTNNLITSYTNHGDNFEIFMKNWVLGIKDEIYFWDNWLKTKGSIWPDDFKRRTSPDGLEFRMPNLLKDIASAEISIDKLKILDVGSSLCTNIGNKWNDSYLDVIAVDPLANIYDTLLTKYNITPYLRTQFSMVEILDDTFPSNHFDLVTMTNALDHTFNPLLGIYQMLNLIKIGGIVYLSHAINEAENANYHGFHQWNLCSEENGDSDDFIIWNKYDKHNITQLLSGFAEVTIETIETIETRVLYELNVRIKKIKDVEYDFSSEKVKILSFLVKIMAYITSDIAKDAINK